MDDDQQFCLRWNNHQSTLISVFDTLLENGTLVDCTLAAEGKFLKAHKVVLSACSPYFATLLSQQYDKHPIFILKDVKFQELRAMMDYMYRGEVNISQDQLAALLKAAESLQIKGLSDNRSSASSGSSAHQQQQQQTQQQKQSDASASAKTLQPPVPASKASGLTIENKRPLKSELLESDVSGSREGSTSPTRKRKKVRRRSVDTNNLLIDNHDQHSNSSSHSIHTASGAAGAATAGAAVGGATGAAAASAGTSSLSSSSAAVGGGAAGGAAAAAGSNAGANVLSAAAVAAAAAIKKTETAQQAAAAELMKLQLQKQQIAAAAAAAAAAASAQSSDDDERCGGPSSVATGTEHDDGNELTDNEHDGDGGSSVKSGARHHREGGRRGNKTSTSTVGDLLIEPKSEYEDGQDENIEDLTMDDEELMDELDQAGPSHGGDVSSQGYAQWPLDREQNEAFIAAQDAVGGQHRDAQDYKMSTNLLYSNFLDITLQRFRCSVCDKSYLRKRHLQRHMRDECIGIPPRFHCDHCESKFRRKYHLVRHMASKHGIQMDPGPIVKPGGGGGGGGASGGGSGTGGGHYGDAGGSGSGTENEEQHHQKYVKMAKGKGRGGNLATMAAAAAAVAAAAAATNGGGGGGDGPDDSADGKFSVDALMVKQEVMTDSDGAQSTMYQNFKNLFFDYALKNVPTPMQ